jgi:serine/threonine protein phosphatase PrpC
VSNGRVDGQLAMSRAMGDFEYKQNSTLPVDKQKVICIPEFEEIKVVVGAKKPIEASPDHEGVAHGDVMIMLSACDGLWDVYNDAEVSAQIVKLLQMSQTYRTRSMARHHLPIDWYNIRI